MDCQDYIAESVERKKGQPFGERLAGAGDVDAQEPFSGVHFAFVDPYVPLLQ